MKIISFSEYEFGLIALGESPFGVISIGTFPVGVIAIGAVPIGIVSIAFGAGIGFVSYSCGASVGLYSRVVGFGAGVNAGGLGFKLTAIEPSSETIPAFFNLSRLRQFLATSGSLVLIFFISWMGYKYFEVSQMNRQASLTWEVSLVKAEGISFPDGTLCVAHSDIRTDSKKRIHATTRILCGDLVLSERTQRKNITLIQSSTKDGFRYQMAANSLWKSSYTSEVHEKVEESPGLEFDSIDKGTIVLLAEESPYRVELSVKKLSNVHNGQPLLVGKSKLEGVGFW